MNRALCGVVLWLIVSSLAGFGQQPKQDKTTKELWTADRQRAREAYNKKDWAAYRDALLQYHKDFPGSSHALKDLGTAEANLGNSDAALKWMQPYVDCGLTFDANKPELANLYQRNPELKKKVEANAQPIGHANTVFRLNSPDLIAEDIAYDPGTKQLFISSVRERKILSCDLAGKCTDFVTQGIAPPLWGVLAVRADPSHKVLWATTASLEVETDHHKSDEGKSAVLKFDLHSGKLLKRYEPPDKVQHAMGDMAVAANGDAFISDGLSGDVFVVRHDKETLEKLVPEGTFLSPQTPALSEDQKTLFVPDYAAGIAAVNLHDGSVHWLKSSVPAATDGTDGLYYRDGWLLAVQNGVEPERIARFHLGSDDQIDRWEALESNTSGLGDPTHGVMVGNDFYFIANSGWDRVQDDGTMKAGEAAEIRKMRIQ